jgi:hypothetical protein
MSYIPARTTPHSDPLVIAPGGLRASLAQKRAARDIARIRLRGAVITARELTRIDAVGETSEAALVTAAGVSMLEGALAQQTPHAQGQLKYITNASSIALGRIVDQVGRDI